MRNTKTEFRYFMVPEWKKEEEYLREQHKNGWEFVKVNFCLYHFKKCSPGDVVYQLDFNPASTTQKEEYIQMFQDCGWEYLQNHVGYSYFRKAASEMNGTEEIFCDDASRLDMVGWVFKQRMVPLLCIFFLIIIPQIFIQSQWDTLANHIFVVAYWILFGLYLVAFIKFAVQFWKCFKSIHK